MGFTMGAVAQKSQRQRNISVPKISHEQHVLVKIFLSNVIALDLQR